MSKIQLHVKSLTCKETVINCLNDITVYDLKKLINNEEAYMLRLLHKNKELEDEQFLNQIDINYYIGHREHTGIEQKELIQQIQLGVSLADIWFVKRRQK